MFGIILPDNRVLTLANKLPKCVLICLSRWKNFVMIPRDAGNKTKVWLECQKITVKFIAFIHEIFTGRVKFAHLAVANLSPYGIAKGQPQLLKQPNGHG